MKGEFSDARGGVALQIQQVDNFINQGMDAIILNLVDTRAVSMVSALVHQRKITNYYWSPYQTVTKANYPQFTQQQQK